MKHCSVCLEVKPLIAFHIDRDKPLGRASRCKDCGRAYMKKYYASHQDAIKARAARWYVANYDRAQVANAMWAIRNRDKAREIKNKWQKLNGDYRNESLVRRRRAKGSATPKWADKAAMRELYKLARHLSDETGVKHHVDHIVPLQSKIVCGLHVEHNLRVIPWMENVLKHNRHWPDMPEAN
jgi:hypothetical protein